MADLLSTFLGDIGTKSGGGVGTGLKPTLRIEGAEAAAEMVRSLGQMAGYYENATVVGKERADGSGLTNAHIAEFLRAQGRNFFETDSVSEAAAAAFAQQIEKEAQLIQKAKRASKSKPINYKARAGKVWRSAIIAAAEAAAANINNGTFEGGGSPRLSKQYDEWKEMTYGFSYPIGKATGDLLNNLAAHVGNIKLHKA